MYKISNNDKNIREKNDKKSTVEIIYFPTAMHCQMGWKN